MSVLLRPAARSDIAEIAKYIASENPVAARNWRRDILESCRTLGAFPQVGTARDDLKSGLRTFPKGNYIIVFRTIESGHSTRCSFGARLVEACALIKHY